MKRGLITWDKAQLPPEALAARLASLHRHIVDFNVPALVAFTDVWRSNDVRYISNYMPYWNRALTVVPAGEQPILLCALSPRVYPWIKSVTLHEQIVPSPNLGVQLLKLCADRGWTKIGVLDHAGLPNDLYNQLAADPLQIIDMPRNLLRAATSDSELVMHRHAAQVARSILDDCVREVAADLAGISLTDFGFAGRLERRLRRAGAEDLFVLISNGRTPPLPAAGHRVDGNSSVTVCLEYNGHWAKLSRNVAGLTSPLPPAAGATVHRESLAGPYAWVGIDATDSVPGSVIAMQVEMNRDGIRLYYGETCLQGRENVEVL